MAWRSGWPFCSWSTAARDPTKWPSSKLANNSRKSLRRARILVASGPSAHPLEFLLQLFQLVIAQIFKINETRAGTGNATEKFIEFQMNGLGVPVLCVLDQEDHQEGDDGGRGVNHQLPRVGK